MSAWREWFDRFLFDSTAIPEGQTVFPTPQPVRLPPMLKDIVVEPVIYSGEAIKHKLIMRFDRGEIIVGIAQNADGLLQLRKDIYAELGMDEA